MHADCLPHQRARSQYEHGEIAPAVPLLFPLLFPLLDLCLPFAFPCLRLQSVTIAERTAVRAVLDVYASAHGCEEFWYDAR